MHRPLRRALAASAVLLAAGLPLATPASAREAASADAAPARVPGPVVLIGTGGLRWDDLDDDTPALAAVLAGDATANLAVRSVHAATCPIDGWLAVSAGRRAADGNPPQDCLLPRVQVAAAGGPGRVQGWERLRSAAAAESFDADPGLLGATLAAAGRTVAAVGPGAAIAAADRSGTVARAWPGLSADKSGIDPAADAVGLAGQVRAALATSPDLLVVDLGSVRDPGIKPAAARAVQVAALDSRLGLVLDAVPATATVIMASLADSSDRGRLQLAAAFGPTTAGRFDAGLLRSSSTRQDGLVQSTDLLPTLLEALGVGVPASAVGSPLRRVDGGGEQARRRSLVDLGEKSLLIEQVAVGVFVVALVTELALVAGVAWLARANRHRPVVRRRALVLTQLVGVAGASLPLATYAAGLLPWWRVPFPGVALGGAVFVATVVLTLAAVAGPWRRAPLGSAAAACLLFLVGITADLATGSRLQLVALIAGQPIVAGRFYGLSNPTFALFATAGLIVALAVARRLLDAGRPPRQAALAVAAVGAAVTVVDAAPFLGSDFGGPPAIVPAFGLLALWVAGVPVTRRRLLALAGGTVALLAAVAVTDWLRPPSDRSHLGRFVQSVIDGDAGATVGRKLAQNLGGLTSGPVMLLIPVATALVAYALWRPERVRLGALGTAYRREPLLRRTLAATGVMVLLGFAANDSGTSVPPAAGLLLLPVLVAISARAVQWDEAERLEREVRRAARGANRR